MHFSKNSPNLIVQNISRPNKDDPYSVSPAMAALPIYAKVNKLDTFKVCCAFLRAVFVLDSMLNNSRFTSICLKDF
jgi:hypothetical protein